jgi:coenzyme F420-0:L-glutamate ligase/coenzyme F420-1:gamma-L-glutamate ligase
MPPSAPSRIEIVGLSGIPEVAAGANLARLVLDALAASGDALEDGDVLVVTQKIVSKAEGRVVTADAFEPSALARETAKTWHKDPRAVEAALAEARRVVKMDRGVLITETRHGFVCANSGVDASNLAAEDALALLPLDPDASATRLRAELERATGRRLAVLISDTFGRPWREGVVNVAVGVAGMDPLVDYRGERDSQGRSLSTTQVAAADEIAAAAELVMGKLDRVPVAVVRGAAYTPAEGSVKPLLRAAGQDLFR